MSSYSHYSYGGGDDEPIDSKIDRVLRNLRQIPDDNADDQGYYRHTGGKRKSKAAKSTKKARGSKRRTSKKSKKRTVGKRRTGKKKTKRGGNAEGIEYF